MILALVFQGIEVGTKGWIQGLKIVAVAVVAHAILGMANSLTPDLKRKAIALFALVITLLWQSALSQFGVIILSAIIGLLLYHQQTEKEENSYVFPVTKRFAITCLSLFFGLLFLLPILREVTSIGWIAMFDSFYRSGSLVFGGGHVVLPLLEREFVPTGWLSKDTFLVGYGVTQAVPGPLFTFAAYLGAVMNGWQGGIVATIAMFLPAFLLIFGTLPFWDALRNNQKVKGALMGVNAAVVGILISAFYQPIWTSSILKPIHFAFAAILFSLLVFWKLPPWVIVVVGALGGLFL